MRILFSASTYPHKGNQFTAFVKVLCEEMVRQGHEVTVITPQSISRVLLRGEGLLPKITEYDVETSGGIKKIRVFRPWTISFGFGYIGRMTLIWDRMFIERCLGNKMGQFDVVYAHFWRSGFKVARLAKYNKKKLIVATGEDVININKYISTKEIEDLRDTTSGVVCVSTKNKEESIRLGLTTEEKCVVLPNSVNRKSFYPRDKAVCRKKLGFPEDMFIVAFCGRFNRRKGADRISAAIKQLNDSKIGVVFIGRDVENQHLELDCPGILHKGPLLHEQIPEYLSAADVFVLPTLAEGCSNSIVEALACGLPVISSDLPFNYDILNKDNSIMVDPMDVNAIAISIKKLKDDLEFRKKLKMGVGHSAKQLGIEERTNNIMSFISYRLNE